MPRKPRFFIQGIANHVIQRGNNKMAVFFEDQDYYEYLRLLKEASEAQRVKIHSYVLMTNHVHLLVTPEETNGVSLMMQQVGRNYVPYINYKYMRTGTLWEGRFKCSLVADSSYVLACMRYIELNPVRANMVFIPEDYKWSSYRSNAFGESNDLINHHECYLGMASTITKCQNHYRDLFKESIDSDMTSEIRNCTQTGTPLGSDKFKSEVEEMLKVKVGYSKKGRPKKSR